MGAGEDGKGSSFVLLQVSGPPVGSTKKPHRIVVTVICLHCMLCRPEKKPSYWLVIAALGNNQLQWKVFKIDFSWQSFFSD